MRFCVQFLKILWTSIYPFEWSVDKHGPENIKISCIQGVNATPQNISGCSFCHIRLTLRYSRKSIIFSRNVANGHTVAHIRGSKTLYSGAKQSDELAKGIGLPRKKILYLRVSNEHPWYIPSCFFCHVWPFFKMSLKSVHVFFRMPVGSSHNEFKRICWIREWTERKQTKFQIAHVI